MRLTPGRDRDSMWSTPLARVKKRSNRPVMSVSICSGGIPEKNVATTTTGILIGGNRSTGIRTRLVTPTTHVIRHRTRMRYGYRREKRDMRVSGGAFAGDCRSQLSQRQIWALGQFD